MYKIIGALSLFAVLPISAAVSAVPTGATVYNANAVMPVNMPARAATQQGSLRAAVQHQQPAPARGGFLTGAMGAGVGTVNVPGAGSASNVVTNNPGQVTPPPPPPVVPEVPTMSVQQCMGMIESCVNRTLPGGIRNLFDENMRNSIINGMNLCQNEVEDCRGQVLLAVRVSDAADAATIMTPVYRNNADVWVDFNSRVVMPQYYAFTLQRTGLTPRQAEAVCKMIDRNMFGTSFAAVGITNRVTTELDRNVAPYNLQGEATGYRFGPGDQPMGPGLNRNPVDAMRGYYGRWDAERAQCLVRVAAYYNTSLIQNRWTAGLGMIHERAGFRVGSGEWAEVWRTAGESFSCNNNLFGFNMLTSTKENAVSGAVLGGATGAIIGAVGTASKLKDVDCSNQKHREALVLALRPFDCHGDIGEICRPVQAGATAQAGDAATPAGQATAARANWTINNFAQCGKALEHIRDNFQPETLAVVEKTWADEFMGAGGRALIGGGIGAAGGAGLAAAITYFVETNNITCRVGDNLETVGYNKSFSIPTLKDFYVKWALNMPDSDSSNPLPITGRGDWENVCRSPIAGSRDACEEIKVNYRREGLITGMTIWNACTWTGDELRGTCGINRITCLSYGVCTLGDIR